MTHEASDDHQEFELDEPALARFAAQLARALPPRFVLYLSGELGAGKSTFARAFVRALLPDARVKSPTYGLIEPYRFDQREILHLDLYRIADAQELEQLGMRDLAGAAVGLLIEWPEHGAGRLPAADILIRLRHSGSMRAMTATAMSPTGRKALAGSGFAA